MSYAIIRNAKYKMSNASGVSRHNERKNKNYSNEDIDLSKSNLNYHLKVPVENSYEKEFYRLREQNKLKGNLRLTGKKQSNVMCEFLITSDSKFFEKIGKAETERYFKTAYEFASKKCGEENIISAVVHLDEATPHMHLTYIPVVEGIQKKERVRKINCSEFWRGFNSYGQLQDKFYDYMKAHEFNLERGERTENLEEKKEHLSVQEFKRKTLDNEVKDLEQKKNSVENHLNGLKSDLNCLKDLHIDFEEIERIEGKDGLISKSKVTIKKNDFETLKAMSKKCLALERENVEMKEKIDKLSKVEGFSIDYKIKFAKLQSELVKTNKKLEVVENYLKKTNQIDRLNEFIKAKKINKKLTNEYTR